MDIIKDLIKQLIKMNKQYNEYKNYIKFLCFKYNEYLGNIKELKKELLTTYYNMLVNKYQIDINLSDLKFIVNNYNINDKLFKSDLSLNQIELLNLYDLKYLGQNYFRIKIKTIKNNNSLKKNNVNFIIVNYKGGDKQYNIVLFKHKIDYSVLCNYLNKSNKIKKDKLKTFFKKNKYNYSICKNKVFRNKEFKIISGKKYSHNFKNSNKTNNNYKKYNDMDNTYNLLNILLNDYYSNTDLLKVYVNDYNIENHIINIDIILNRLIDNMEKQYKIYTKTNKDKYYVTFKFMLDNFNIIKSFFSDIKEYKHYLIKNNDLYNKKTIINDYF